MAMTRVEPVEVRVRTDWLSGRPREIRWGERTIQVTAIAAVRRETAALVEAIDVRDLLLASRLDLDLLGDDEAAHAVRGRVAGALRGYGDALERIAALSASAATRTPPGDERTRTAPRPPPTDALLDGIFDAADPRTLLLPAFVARLERLRSGVQRIGEAVLGTGEPPPLSREQLRLFAATESWPLAALRANLSLQSPVLRHAVRMGLALAAAYFIALQLPWRAHPHWLVLGVAVVLRGTLEQTLTRRNDRVSGTVIGCLLVMLVARLQSPTLMLAAFLAGVGVAHAFVTVRYRVTAIAATVMALLQAHLVDPQAALASSSDWRTPCSARHWPGRSATCCRRGSGARCPGRSSARSPHCAHTPNKRCAAIRTPASRSAWPAAQPTTHSGRSPRRCGAAASSRAACGPRSSN